MRDTIIVEVENRLVYGKILHYPLNGNAKKACKLVKARTLSSLHLDVLKEMGFIIAYS